MVVKLDKVPFEDALNMTGFSKFNLLMFLLCSSIIVGMGFEVFSVSYLVPASVCELGTSSTQQGLIAGIPLTGVIMTSHFWGYLADTRGRRKILALSMSIGFLAGALAAFSPNWIVLAILKFASSASVSGAFALSLTLLSECTPKAKRSALVILTTSVSLASTGLMAVLSIPILPLKFSYYIPYLNIHLNSWRLLDLIFSLPALFSAIGVACAYESPRYLLSVGKDKEALAVMKGVFVMNHGGNGDDFQVNSVVLNEENAALKAKGIWSSMIAQTIPMMKPPLLKRTLLLSLLFCISFICMNPFLVWVPFIVNAFMSSVVRGEVNMTFCEMITTAKNATLVDVTANCSMNITAMTMVFGISMFLSLVNLVTAGLIGCVGRKTLVIGIQVIGGLSALLVNTTYIWVVSAFLFMIFLLGVINFGLLTTYSVDIFPTYVKAMAVCLTLMVGRGSAVLGINILKRLLDSDCEAAFYIFGSVTLAGGIVGLLLPSDATITQESQKIEEKS
ncbi:hypothetical protein K1T71_006459 [Dendrolimus kikuchii]|uniref:Uncharacterized protein n=1 Tax=Dendrolimus kikuchii TaxID=765133 RepID=A0ACC1D0X5_9NEOP|nr:hypothetical protein K1T71_006459 [Dendrolimus kikuchii]